MSSLLPPKPLFPTNKKDRGKEIFTRFFVGFFAVSLFLAQPGTVSSAAITYASDRLSVPLISRSTDHTVTFTLGSALPPGGHLILTPETGSLTVPSLFGVAEADLAVNGTEKMLAASAGSGNGSAIGFAVVSGSGGSWTFTLNDTDSIPADAVVRVKLGSNAIFGTTGTHRTVLVTTPASYRLRLRTTTAAGATIDEGQTRFVVTRSVALSVSVDSATAPGNNPTVSLTTPTAGGSATAPATITLLASASDSDGSVVQVEFYNDGVLLGVDDTAPYSLIWADAPVGSYSFTARALDNSDRTASSVAVAYTVTAVVASSGSSSSSSGGGGGGGGGGGFVSAPAVETKAPETIVIDTSAILAAEGKEDPVTVTKGVVVIATTEKVTVSVDEATVQTSAPLEIGVLSGRDYELIIPVSKAHRMVVGVPKGFATANKETKILVVKASAPGAAGVPMTAGGQAVAGGAVYRLEAVVDKKNVSALSVPISLTLSYDEDFAPASVGLYYASAGEDRWRRALGAVHDPVTKTVTLKNLDHLTLFTVLGVPKAVVATCGGDLNSNSRVDLTDVSILLSNWGVPKNPRADLNGDGKVNLTDFSIMLYCWTG